MTRPVLQSSNVGWSESAVAPLPGFRARPRTCRASAALAAIASAAFLAGCLNESTTLTHAGPRPLPDLAGAEGGAPDSSPASVATTTLAREDWPTTVLLQPRGQVDWSFFGTEQPGWAVARGPGALPALPPPAFAGAPSPRTSPPAQDAAHPSTP
jgi:hypothetical protein